MKILRVVAVGVLFVGIGGGQARGNTSPLVETPLLTSFELSNEKDVQVIEIDLSPKPGATLDANAAVVSVAVAEQPRPSLHVAFRPEVTGARLAVSVKFAKLLEAKTYAVTFQLRGNVSADGGAKQPATQLLAITFVLPPPKLRAIAPIVIEEVRWNPFSDSTVSARLKLVELSRTTGIQRLLIEQADPAMHGGTQSRATFAANEPPKQLAAGGNADVVLTGTQFENGTTTGTVTITGDLVEPTTVTYEVRARLTTFYIVVCFLVFGLIGWVVRHYLKNAEARAEFRAQLEPLRVRARGLLATASAELRFKLQEALDEVARALAAANQEQAQKAADTLRSRLEAALAAETAEVERLLGTITTLRHAIQTKWDLPLDLAASANRLDLAETALIAGDRKTASEEIGRVVAVITQIGAAANEWNQRAKPALSNYLTDASALVPATVRADASALLETAQASVGAVPHFDPATPPEAADFLRKLHTARRDARRLVTTVKSALEDEARATAEALKTAGKTTDQIALVTSAAAIPDHEDPAKGVTALVKALTAFATKLKDHVKSAEAQLLITQGRYAAAVLKQHALDTQVDQTVKIAATESVLQLAIAQRTAAAEPAQPAPIPVVVRSGQVDPVVVARVELQKLRLLRGITSALIMSIGAWGLYHSSWVGTAEDFLKVGVVAFFSDFTLAAVIDAVGKLRPSSPTT